MNKKEEAFPASFLFFKRLKKIYIMESKYCQGISFTSRYGKLYVQIGVNAVTHLVAYKAKHSQPGLHLNKTWWCY